MIVACGLALDVCVTCVMNSVLTLLDASCSLSLVEQSDDNEKGRNTTQQHNQLEYEVVGRSTAHRLLLPLGMGEIGLGRGASVLCHLSR